MHQAPDRTWSTAVLFPASVTLARQFSSVQLARAVAVAQICRLTFLSLFYALSYVFRPYRAFANVVHVLRNRPRTKGERALIYLLRRINQLKSVRSDSPPIGTV